MKVRAFPNPSQQSCMSRERSSGRTRRARPILVLVLVPSVETDDPTLEFYNDFTHSHAEFKRAFAELDLAWRWQPVTIADYRDVIAGMAEDRGTHRPVIFNLCDGDETNGVPGISVIRCLDEHGLPYTGADERFFRDTTSKIDMKITFDAAGVPTAPWEVITSHDVVSRSLFERIGRPLIVKPAVSAGSLGISIRSVVDTPRALRAQLRRLSKGFHGWDVTSGGVFVERFISGPEYTTFIVGSHDAPERARIYPAVERIFFDDLPDREKFLSFDRLWETFEEEDPVSDDASLWEYDPVPEDLQTRIHEVSWAAYAAMGGHGYGRVDLRMDAATGELHVLEVNAQCGLSEDENYTSIGAVVRVAGLPYSAIIREIIDEALQTGVPARRSLTA